MILLGTIASSLLQNVDNGVMDPLQVITVGPSGASTITFTNIPSTYSHLQVRGVARTTRATFANDGLAFYFNGDNAANYSRHQFAGDASGGIDNGPAANSTFMFTQVGGNGAGTNIFGAAIVDILDYSNTNKYKTARMFSGVDNNSAAGQQSGFVSLASGSWRNTNAITSITFYGYSGNFLQNTSLALYGIKGAE